jgi:phosphatidylglycerophosphate synthase
LRSVAATEGLIISASRMGKFKMLAQVVTVSLLIVASFSGKPPVANFGRPFPAIEFWSVPELRTALQHLFGAGATSSSDWQVLLYTLGRAMLWVVVLSACASMYSYFRAFYRSISERDSLKVEAPQATDATTP